LARDRTRGWGRTATLLSALLKVAMILRVVYLVARG
jgi:hypothetical protein